MAAFSDSDNEFPSVLAYAYSTQLKDILTGSHGEMTMWWLFYFLLCDDVFFEKCKYGYAR